MYNYLKKIARTVYEWFHCNRHLVWPIEKKLSDLYGTDGFDPGTLVVLTGKTWSGRTTSSLDLLRSMISMNGMMHGMDNRRLGVSVVSNETSSVDIINDIIIKSWCTYTPELDMKLRWVDPDNALSEIMETLSNTRDIAVIDVPYLLGSQHYQIVREIKKIARQKNMVVILTVYEHFWERVQEETYDVYSDYTWRLQRYEDQVTTTRLPKCKVASPLPSG